MLRALNTYIGYVQMLQAGADKVFVEQRVSVNAYDGLVWGTTDCAASGFVGYRHWLEIVDLKFGTGVPVAPDSAQLKIYALAAAATLWPGQVFHDFILTVHQPRLDPHPRTLRMTATDLKTWKDAELVPAIQRITGGDQKEVAGPHCRFCVRKAECDAFHRLKTIRAAEVFDDGVVDSFNVQV
jgi:hypothetical protein